MTARHDDTAPVGTTLTGLLRAPGEIARRCLAGRDLPTLANASLLAVAAGGAIFGATLGLSRGGLQVLFAAVKVPIAMLLTLVLMAPALYALANVHGRDWSLRATAALMLSATARACLVLLSFVPVLVVAHDAGVGYHALAFGSALAYGVSGLAAVGVLLRAIGKGTGLVPLAASLSLCFALVGGQSAWILRPYLGRPAQASVPFVRAPEDAFIDRVLTSARSATGDYDAPETGR